MSGFSDLFSSAKRGWTALIGAAAAVSACAVYRAGRAMQVRTVWASDCMREARAR